MTEPTLRDQLQASLGTAYTIQRELGGGGMSRVFVARDESLEVYLDSIIVLLEDRNISGPGEADLRLFLANAYAQTGRLPEARRELDRARAAARLRNDGTPRLNQRIVAGILGALGQYDEAVCELRDMVSETSWARAGLAREPKLRTLRGNPLYEAFLRERE